MRSPDIHRARARTLPVSVRQDANAVRACLQGVRNDSLVLALRAHEIRGRADRHRLTVTSSFLPVRIRRVRDGTAILLAGTRWSVSPTFRTRSFTIREGDGSPSRAGSLSHAEREKTSNGAIRNMTRSSVPLDSNVHCAMALTAVCVARIVRNRARFVAVERERLLASELEFVSLFALTS